ncbi:MAG: LamG domain-containing protein, partial [Saprospiraceae bacterium]|nr:LamG domain-containing protein [Saprospiraceae bacterium]
MQTLLIEKRAELIIILLLFFLVIISPLHIFGQQTEPNNAVVRYHLSFDDDKFFKEDIIEQSGKKSLEERKIDFPPGKFGKGIRMREIPPVTDAINMTGIDLDLVTAVIFNTRPGNEMGFNQPFIWGSGRINPRLGSVAFWAKGALSFAAPLFEQTSVGFGRKERELLGIVVDENNILSAYIRDARYVKHTLKSSYSWEPNQWNHVVLNWDWAKGMELWVNGMIVASSWGRDAWFENTLPGLFHLPAPGLTYDELYLLDRPLSAKEIKQLLRKNQAPDPVGYKRDQVVNQKILEISGVNAMDDLPTAEPGHTLVFREVFPENVSDGHIPGWYVVDGRNEIAWPHPTAMFTIIPGDADFHAEKVDLATSSSSRVNYAIVTGNLDKVRLQASTERLPGMENMFSVPTGEEFIFASTFATQRGATFRIPFTESFGTPDDFSGNIHVPLSGDKRIQNIQLYYCQSKSASVYPIGDKLIIQPGFMTMDERWSVAFQALTSGDERKIVIATDHPESRSVGEYDISTFARLNIISEPYTDPTGIKTITLSLPVHCEKTEEVLFIRLRDPAVPSRIWNQLAIKLVNYNQGYKTFQLKIDCEDLVLTGGDRLWLDLGTAGKSNILTGDSQNEAALYVEEAPVYEVLNAYSTKELISAKAQYSKMYEFMPWQFTGKDVSLELPYCFGGPFDMLLPALAVHRVDPNNFEANYLIKVSGPDYKDGKPIHPEKTALISLPNPLQAPDWALYMHDFNLKRHKMADWWADQQNEDGQIGGGWNDDVLFLSFHQPDLPLDGNENARYLIDATHKGLEATRYFKDGYCNVYPMDRLHIGDFISERYNTLVNNLGQAYVYEREMESAWHLGKEEQTPVNYFADGFKSSVNVFNWYWGNDIPETPYESKSLDELTDEFRLYTSVFDEYAYYRFTESNVHRDDYSPYGANNM